MAEDKGENIWKKQGVLILGQLLVTALVAGGGVLLSTGSLRKQVEINTETLKNLVIAFHVHEVTGGLHNDVERDREFREEVRARLDKIDTKQQEIWDRLIAHDAQSKRFQRNQSDRRAFEDYMRNLARQDANLRKQ